MKKMVWISYDFGMTGDYEGLFAWIDNHNAKECGNSIATLEYEHDGVLVDDLEKDLAQSISFAKHDRIYVIWRDDRKEQGKFIFGRRKAAPWAGYGAQEPQVDEEGQ